MDGKLEGTTEWIILNSNNKEWITVQRSDLIRLSPFLLTNDWEGCLINELHQSSSFWPRGFRVMSDPTLSIMSHSVLIGEMPRSLFYQFYSESVLSNLSLYNETLNISYTLEDIWPNNGLRLPFKSEITPFDKEVEPKILDKMRYFRYIKCEPTGGELDLSLNVGSKKHNSFSLKLNYEGLKTLLRRFSI